MNTAITPAAPQQLAALFNQGLEEHIVRYQRCSACQAAQSLARYACQTCGEDALIWQNATGLATVRAITVVARAPSDEFRPLAPYALVLVQLDEGPRLMAHAAPNVSIGDRVQVGFFEFNGRTLMRFSPAA